MPKYEGTPKEVNLVDVIVGDRHFWVGVSANIRTNRAEVQINEPYERDGKLNFGRANIRFEVASSAVMLNALIKVVNESLGTNYSLSK